MINPILKNRSYLLGYIGSWLLLSILYVIIHHGAYDFKIGVSIVESFVYSDLFALIGIGLWYPIYFSLQHKRSVFMIVSSHTFTAFVAVGFWLWISFLLLKSSIEDADYLIYLKQSVPWRLGLGIILYSLMVMVYYLIIYYNNFKEKLVKESELKALVKESELSSLKAQINPHFLFNSLNSISSLTIISPERAQEMVIKLSDFLRYSLSHSTEGFTTLEEELTNINRYLDIEKIRFGKRLQIIKLIDEHCYRHKLPGLILQPVLENAIKYGVYESTESSYVKITCNCTNTLLEVTVINDYDPDIVPKKGAGIGLTNIRGRLKVLYGSSELISIFKTDSKFEVNLKFPQTIE